VPIERFDQALAVLGKDKRAGKVLVIMKESQ